MVGDVAQHGDHLDVVVAQVLQHRALDADGLVLAELGDDLVDGADDRRGVAVTLETIYTVTDPPVRLFRRIIPMVRIGGLGLDLSIMVLLLVVFFAMQLATPS